MYARELKNSSGAVTICLTSIGTQLGLDWAKINLEQFRSGLEAGLEHSAHDPETNATDDDLIPLGKIAWGHLKEFPDYYINPDKLEAKANAYWYWASRR